MVLRVPQQDITHRAAPSLMRLHKHKVLHRARLRDCLRECLHLIRDSNRGGGARRIGVEDIDEKETGGSEEGELSGLVHLGEGSLAVLGCHVFYHAS